MIAALTTARAARWSAKWLTIWMLRGVCRISFYVATRSSNWLTRLGV